MTDALQILTYVGQLLALAYGALGAWALAATLLISRK